jgi:Ca-activated chloride channel homolog
MRVNLSVRLMSAISGLLFVCLFVGLSANAQPVAKNAFPPVLTKSSDDTIKLNTQVVSLTITVTDKQGQPVTGLAPQAFQIYEDNVAQEISYFSYSDQPLSVGVVFDLSGSMGREKLQRAKDALKSFAATCHAEDDLALIGFNDRAWLVGNGLLAPDALNNAFGLMTARGQTALYDAVELGLTQVGKGHQPRKVLIIISDGEDNRSRTNFRNLRRMAQENDATIYAIGIQDFAPLHGYGKFILEALADLSGGAAFFPSDAEGMNEAFDRIAVALRQQYSIGYVPSGSQADGQPDGKLRRIKLKVNASANGIANGKIVVRHRTGYIAGGKETPAAEVKADN